MPSWNGQGILYIYVTLSNDKEQQQTELHLNKQDNSQTCISSHRRQAHIMRSCSAAAASERRLTVLYSQHVLNSGLEQG